MTILDCWSGCYGSSTYQVGKPACCSVSRLPDEVPPGFPCQKAVCLAKLLVEEVVPLFGVPESLLSDQGTNLLSHLMTDLWKMLGIKKLNTTAYHPECDRMVERAQVLLKETCCHMVISEISICMVYCMHIVTHPMNLQERSHLTFSLGWTAECQPKQLLYHPPDLTCQT